MASGAVSTGASTSYSTSMRPTASSATCTLTAATAAMAWPRYSAFSCASTLLLRNFRFTAPSPRFSILSGASGRSRCVTTALTPGSASALLVSIDLMRAWACGLRSTLPYSMPGRRTSAP